jgi:site-specific recombinase XerD
MNLNQTFSILFWLNRAKMNSKGLAPIWLRITVDGTRAECSTSRQILPEHWDVDKGEATNACAEAEVINEYLLNVRLEVKKRYNILLTTKEYVSAEDVKNNFRGKKEVKKTFFDVVKQFIAFHKQRFEKEELSEGRFKRFSVLQHKCESFISANYKKNDLVLDSIQLPFVVQFQHYLLTVDDIGHNTTMKYSKDLKQVMKFAVSMGYLVTNPFECFKCTYKKVKRTCLDETELDKIINLKLSIPRLEEVRDCFVFSCFTGYAFSDAHALRPSNVTLGIDRKKWIIHDRIKSDNPENVPLLPKALEIVEKYKDHAYCLKYNKLLPVNSNQRYNAYLKEIADLAGITKKLTTHVARHTFATTVCLTNGVPIETVQKLLAHGDIRTTQIYAQIVPIKVSADMQNLANRLTVQAPTQQVATSLSDRKQASA